MDKQARAVLSDLCSNCVHSILEECPLYNALVWSGTYTKNDVSTKRYPHMAQLNRFVPMDGDCNMYWPRCRRVR